VGAGGWKQRRPGGGHAARTPTGCGAPPVGLWGGTPPPQCAPRTAAPPTALPNVAAHPRSPSSEEARRARGCWRLARAPHWCAPRGGHARRLQGATSRPLGRHPAASVRRMLVGAGHAQRRIPDHTLGYRSVHTACAQKASGGAARRRSRRLRAASLRPPPQCAAIEAAAARATLPATP